VEWRILQLANSNIKQISAQSAKSLTVNGSTIGNHTITMGNIQPLTALTLNNLGNLSLDNLFQINSNVKKYEVIETTEDVLALSATWHRLRSLISHNISNIINPGNRPSSLTDEILFKEMIQEDRERADVIRDYFSKKIMMITLRGQNLSGFRKELNSFIHGDCKVFKEELLPLIYRLPEFYDNDIQHDEMFRDFNKQFDADLKQWRGTKTLKPVRKFFISLKTKKFLEYWLKDDDNRGYRIEIPFENKLNHLWEHFFEQESIPILGNYMHREHDGINYYQLKNWEIDFTKT
jgi:hypothetical protein